MYRRVSLRFAAGILYNPPVLLFLRHPHPTLSRKRARGKMESMKKIFTKEIAELIDGYEERREQVDMADSVLEALESGESLIIEAGTGVGKTLAYLAPMAKYAVENKKRVIVATYSKALQNQIMEKDLPLLAKIFDGLRYETLYGSGNYLCSNRAKDFSKKGNLFADAEEYSRIIDYLRDAEGIRENSEIEIPHGLWSSIRREKELCGEEFCTHFKKCFYWKKRRAIFKSHIIVVNHHLFFSDIMVNKKLLPDCDAAVFDEAHKLEEVMREMFGRKFSLKYFKSFAKDVEDFFRRRKKITKKSYAQQKARLKACVSAVEDFLFSLCDRGGMLYLKDSALAPVAASEGAPDITLELNSVLPELRAAAEDPDNKDLKKFAEYLLKRTDEFAGILSSWAARSDKDCFYWAEKSRGNEIELSITPYDLRESFERHILHHYETAVLTSATLSAGDEFGYIKRSFGLEKTRARELKSPFDYESNAMLYIEKNMPMPNEPGYREELTRKIIEIIEATRGNTLVLFTNIEMMKHVYAESQDAHPGIPMLMQGQAAPMALVEEFRKEPSVLFATSTFWQGIDIKGDDLRCVVITKLPFEMPEHPLQKAVYAKKVEQGGSDFAEIALPRAVFMLKQGFGRLIRSKTDYGAVFILDTRIVKKSYGRRFISALPEMRVVSETEAVRRFLKMKAGL